jgi:hypothetical protein
LSPRGIDSAVTGDDLVVVAYQHRIGKPKCPDAVGDSAGFCFLEWARAFLTYRPEFRYWN